MNNPNNNHEPTLYWIDYETWGVNPATDKPCQFAGVRTDMDLNIIGEPLVIYCQPPNDYLPSPEACLITGITPQIAVQKGLSEPEFMAKIHQEMAKPNTCVVGYNNVRFDDEVTRYGLYRNFIDPYGWAWQNGNSRWDLLDVLRTCYALRPDGINWPLNEDGFPSFKLEKLSVANGIEHANAHDAMADVIATIEMAKLIKNSQPKLYSFLFKHRNKNPLNAMIDIVNMTPLVHISGMFGSQCGNTSWIIPIAWHPKNKNAVIAINLAQDPSPLFDLDAEQLRNRLYTKRSELSEGELPTPLKLVHINKCPILAPAKTLKAEDAQRLGIDREQCLRHLAQIKAHPELREKLNTLYSKEPDYPKSDNVDTQLYGGFFSPADRATMDIILETKPENLPALELNVKDNRIEKLLFNYRARNFPMTLDENEMLKWNHHRRDYFDSYGHEFMFKLEQLAEEHQENSDKMAILKKLYQYAEGLM
ncbi:exodeoxyribonuclease I [Vibrio sp. SS-MA-C1-2]|uniref:exodeoxyribonuclease I n=1 Tax=Vibrio sp. SS-MA-C1-2 TaxID=2908646 RepID=UPI001F34E8E2|nr:exodeoxyribonuclease I [Vibrio sp. SS-MA-C1-2]UJF16984.1 exodeoxyribonuclease I [Vibrio sp. SS-MA-C1-2]